MTPRWSLPRSTAPSCSAAADSATATPRRSGPAASCAREADSPRKRSPDMARTQQERREETIARLLDASIETIIEVGYARASAAVIAKRARVSDGALFRHFPTMSDFMAGTAHEVMRRQLDLFTKRSEERRVGKEGRSRGAPGQ